MFTSDLVIAIAATTKPYPGSSDNANIKHNNYVLIKHIVFQIDNFDLRSDKHSMNPESLYRHIGDLLRERRKKLKPPLTQDKLAKQLGMSRAALANIETGRQSVLVHQLYAFASALDLTPEAFLLPPNNVAAKTDVSEFPMPAGLKPNQQEQIARLISGVKPDSNRDKEGRNAKQRKG